MASILIVDDARSTLRAVEALLGREGYTVLTAASGEEALTHIEKYDVDLLLCDVKMPKMDGLTVLRHIKAYDAGRLMLDSRVVDLRMVYTHHLPFPNP